VSCVNEKAKSRWPWLKVIDRTGDTRHEFDPADAAAVAEAEARFKELTGNSGKIEDFEAALFLQIANEVVLVNTLQLAGRGGHRHPKFTVQG
jgi:hypothetical protein